MQNFLRNLAFLIGLMLVLFLVSPSIMGQVFQLFGGLGILPAFLVILIISALPQRSHRKRR